MTCSSSVTTRRVLEDGTVTTSVDVIECTYIFNNGVITMAQIPADGLSPSNTPSASISGSTLTFSNEEGIVFIYEK